VTHAARTLGVSITSARAEFDGPEPGVAGTVTVHATWTGTSEATRALLDELERGPKAFAVTSLSIVQPAPVAGPGTEEVLRVELMLRTVVVIAAEAR
jgi:hypothetical protein